MTPTTEAVKQAAQQAVLAQPDADTRTQVITALRALGIEHHTETEYNRVKKHVVAARNPRPRGGARPNSGRPVSLPADRYIVLSDGSMHMPVCSGCARKEKQ